MIFIICYCLCFVGCCHTCIACHACGLLIALLCQYRYLIFGQVVSLLLAMDWGYLCFYLVYLRAGFDGALLLYGLASII